MGGGSWRRGCHSPCRRFLFIQLDAGRRHTIAPRVPIGRVDRCSRRAEVWRQPAKHFLSPPAQRRFYRPLENFFHCPRTFNRVSPRQSFRDQHGRQTCFFRHVRLIESFDRQSKCLRSRTSAERSQYKPLFLRILRQVPRDRERSDISGTFIVRAGKAHKPAQRRSVVRRVVVCRAISNRCGATRGSTSSPGC